VDDDDFDVRSVLMSFMHEDVGHTTKGTLSKNINKTGLFCVHDEIFFL
jgi:hypothetical protein